VADTELEPKGLLSVFLPMLRQKTSAKAQNTLMSMGVSTIANLDVL